MSLRTTAAAAIFLSCMTGAASAAPDAVEFMHRAIASDAFEIASSKIALGQSHNPKVIAFAKMMIHDHTLTSHHLMTVTKMSTSDFDSRITPGPDGRHATNGLVDQSHADMLDKLGRESGKDFDSDYMSDQVSGHQDAVSMFKDYAQHGDNPRLRSWVRKTLPTLKMHLSHAEGVKASL